MTASSPELAGDQIEATHLAIRQSLRTNAVPTIVDAYNETPLDACVRHLSPVLRPNAAVLDLGCGDGAPPVRSRHSTSALMASTWTYNGWRRANAATPAAASPRS